MKHQLVKATVDHAKCLGPRLRQEDLEDIAFFSPYALNGDGGLRYCILKSKGSAVAAVDEAGTTTAIWGMVPDKDNPGSASIWMMGSNDIYVRYRTEFLRRSLRFLRDQLKEYPLVYTHCLAHHERRRKWLEWTGFVPIKEHTLWGSPVIEYVRIQT